MLRTILITIATAAISSALVGITGFFFFPDNFLILSVSAFFCCIPVSLTMIHFFVNMRVEKILRSIRKHRINASAEKIEFKGKEKSDPVKRLEKEVDDWALERKEEMEHLRQLENYRKEFLGNVSHELKTPIFNIQGYISTLLDGGLDDSRINRNYLVRAEKNVERMIAIVEDLETIIQLERGELTLKPERFDIVTLICDVMDSMELDARTNDISLQLLNDRDKPVIVNADKYRIRQVLVNLIVNSIKYGKPKGTTRIRIYDAGEKAIIEVADNGKGISPEHLPRIFERFYRVDNSGSREKGGTGLGLAIVKHIIEAHRETINVISTEGAGSAFSFALLL